MRDKPKKKYKYKIQNRTLDFISEARPGLLGIQYLGPF